jgi:hypothetical protein
MMYKCAAVLSLAVLPLAAQTTVPTRLPDRPAHIRRKSAAKPPAQSLAPTAQPTIIAPITPEQMPATAPRVSYRNNVLTVDSENSTLSAILGGIRQQTGAQIDNPPTGSNERVAAHLSGTPRQVLASLLDGSGLGYAIVAAPDDPNRVQKVLLTAQSRNQEQPPVAAATNPNQQQMPPADEDPAADLSPADDGPTPEQMNERLGSGPQAQQGTPQQGQAGQQGRTAEQYLQQLRQMRSQNQK